MHPGRTPSHVPAADSASAELAKQRLVDTHTAIIDEHRAAIERTAERLTKAVEEARQRACLDLFPPKTTLAVSVAVSA